MESTELHIISSLPLDKIPIASQTIKNIKYSYISILPFLIADFLHLSPTLPLVCDS